MAVQLRHTDTLAGDLRKLRLDDLSAFYSAQDPQRLLLALLLFSADIGNHIFHHFRPVLKGFPGS